MGWERPLGRDGRAPARTLPLHSRGLVGGAPCTDEMKEGLQSEVTSRCRERPPWREARGCLCRASWARRPALPQQKEPPRHPPGTGSQKSDPGVRRVLPASPGLCSGPSELVFLQVSGCVFGQKSQRKTRRSCPTGKTCEARPESEPDLPFKLFRLTSWKPGPCSHPWVSGVEGEAAFNTADARSTL